MSKKILIIQTAFLGDVILATSLVEQVALHYPGAQIHFLLRSGNESILLQNPHVDKVWVWNKKKNKFFNLIKIIIALRKEKYNLVLNLQRFFSAGLAAILCRANMVVGFDKNPLSSFFDLTVVHSVPQVFEGRTLHEVERNFLLIREIDKSLSLPLAKNIPPKLYFGHHVLDNNSNNQKSKYVVIAPASVWETKQWPKEKWIQLIQAIPQGVNIFLVGGLEDVSYCQEILEKSQRPLIQNLCGKINILQTAILMKSAQRVFCNDSAPLHLASAVAAPTTVIFCSTLPSFGFGPLSPDFAIFEINNLACRPCGIHGKKSCPLKHFRCAMEIDAAKVASTLLVPTR